MTFDENSTELAHLEPAAADAASVGPTPDFRRTARRGVITTAAVVVTVVAGMVGMHAAAASAGQRAAEQPQPTATTFDQEFWDRQNQLSDLVSWIQALPGIKTSGYVTSINNEPADGSTVLVWHGPADRVQQQILDEAHRRGIPISVQQRRYSMADLERAVNQLVAIKSGTGVFRNFTVNGVTTLTVDFDGVVVDGDYIDAPAEGNAAADTALAQTLTATTGVAVKIGHGHAEPY
jgi:hypothetical protein